MHHNAANAANTDTGFLLREVQSLGIPSGVTTLERSGLLLDLPWLMPSLVEFGPSAPLGNVLIFTFFFFFVPSASLHFSIVNSAVESVVRTIFPFSLFAWREPLISVSLWWPNQPFLSLRHWKRNLFFFLFPLSLCNHCAIIALVNLKEGGCLSLF